MVSFLLFFYPPADLVIWRQDRRIRAMLVTCVYEAAGYSGTPALDLPGRRMVTSSSATGFADAALHRDPVVDQIVQSVQPIPIYVEPPPGAVRVGLLDAV